MLINLRDFVSYIRTVKISAVFVHLFGVLKVYNILIVPKTKLFLKYVQINS